MNKLNKPYKSCWVRDLWEKTDNYTSVRAFFGVLFITVMVSSLLILSGNLIHQYLCDLSSCLKNGNSTCAQYCGNSVDTLFYGLIAIATFSVAYIAYYQIAKLRRTSELELLVKIDERWNGPEFLKAKTILYGEYFKVCEKYNLSEEKLKILTRQEEEKYRIEVGQKIIDMSVDNRRKHEFMILLNFLDFLETIGHLYVEQSISRQKLKALFGESLDFYYQLFAKYIEHRQTNYSDIYKAFQKLHEDLNKYCV